MVLSTRRLPSLLRGPGEPGSPALSGTTKALRLPVRASAVTYGFASAAHDLPPRSCSPQRSRKIGGHLLGQGAWLSGRPICRLLLTWTQMGSLRSPGDPSRAFAPLLDPGRTDVPSPCRPHRCCPRFAHSEGFGDLHFGARSRSFGTRCPTLRVSCCHSRARLASGWLARLYREGVEPSGSLREVSARVDVHPPLLFS